jgi:class 3 adenylate cyclase/predicted ATPase/ABC-type lipoprotein export system ATPase subunit
VSQLPSLEHPLAETSGTKSERRNITVLFCDMVGSSALSTRLDPEDLREILRAFQTCCENAVHSFDGHIARYMGDGILAYFGFPAAHEDDAERAIQSAFEVVKGVSGLSFSGATQIQIRIGIATGLVVVGDLIGQGPSQEFAVIGEAPNLAARLQQMAKPNQILVAPSTRRLVGQLFEFADLGEREIKGYSGLVHVWSVLRSSGASRFEARQSARRAPLIGRDFELTVLQASYEKAKGGNGQFVAISGEPGIGKSRLISTFCNLLPSDSSRVLSLQCSSYHLSSPWYPIVRHLHDVLGIGYDASPATKLKNLELFVNDRISEKRASIVPLLAALLDIPVDGHYPPLELTPQQQKRRTFAAMFELLRAQSEHQPVVLLCEDIHWADHTSSELLDLLRHSISKLPILIIATFRPEFRLPWKADARIDLNRLSPAQVASMIEALDYGNELPTTVVGQIISKTDGVPLFVEEVTKTVLGEGLSNKGEAEGGLPWTPSVPETLNDSLMARLDQLPSTKTIAQVAAAIGREFSFDLLEAVVPMPHEDVREAIDGLQEAGLILRREQSAIEMYTFKHALVQDTAYASMLRSERQPLHARIAKTLATKFIDVAEGAPEIVAYHYTQAREAGLAIQYWLKAGQHASKRSAFMEATTHFQTALKLLEELPEDKERLELEIQSQQSLANASIAAKGFGAEETMLALNCALKLCDKLDDSPQVFPVLNGLVGAHLMRGEIEIARELAQDLLKLAQNRNDRTALLMGHRVLGMSLFVLGELDAAKRELQNAMALYDPEQHAPLALVFSQDFKATAHAYLGLTTVLMGEIESGLAHGRDALAYAQQLRHPHSVCYVLSFVAGAHLVAGDPRAALPVAERTITYSNEYGFPQWSAGGLMLRGWAHVDLGNVEAGLADLRDSISGLAATGTLIWMQFAHCLLARAFLASGQLYPALDLVERILAEIGASGSRWYEAEIYRLKGDILRRQGKPVSEIEPHYEAAISVAKRQGARIWELKAVESLNALRKVGATT